MRIQIGRALATLLPGIALAIGLGSCATDSSTPLEQAGVEIEITPSSLEGTLDVEYGGASGGVVFRVKGSSAADLYYWTVMDNDAEDGDPNELTMPPGLLRVPNDPIVPTAVASNTLAIRGIPTACGSYPITLVVHNYPQHEQILLRTIAIEVGGPTCPPPVITNSSLVFFQDFQNDRRLGVSGGTPPFTWQALSPLPNQISLNSQTGVLSGRPTSSGTFQITVRVTDSEFRTHDKPLSLEIKVVTAADFTGTWSGVLTKGFLVAAGQSGPTFTNVTGQRLSLLFQDPVSNGTTQVSSIDQGTLGATVLTGMEFSLEPGPFPGLWNGAISTLGWHLGCDPLPTGQLQCIGHSFNGPQYNAEVVLTKIDADTEDTTAPQIQTSSPSDGQQNVQSFEVSVTFDEAMSGSASVLLSGGTGNVGPPAFVPNDPTTVKIPLVNVQDDTPYTLTLNPSGQNGFKDVAGNALATTSINFRTGILTPVTLSVFAEGAGNGTVASGPPGIQCGLSNDDCSADFSVGRVVTLTAIPAFGSEFVGWTGASCPGVGSCVFTMNASLTVGARFEPIPTYALTVNPNGTGGGSVASNDGGIDCGSDCEHSYMRGTTVTLQVVPDSTSTFQGWSGACAGVTVSSSCNVTMDAAKTVTATFNAFPNFTLTVNSAGSGGGTVSAEVAGSPIPLNCSGSTCTASLASGTSVSLTGAPNGASSFGGWTGDCTSNDTCSVTMTANRTVIATFTTLPSYTLTVILDGSGIGTVSATVAGSALPLNCSGSTCTASLISGTSVSLTASPNGTSSFAGWSGDCTGISICSVSMTAARNVTATFSTLPSYTLTVTSAGTGTGTVNATVGGSPVSLNCSGSTCSTSLISGTSVTLTASPNGTASFGGWSGDCSGATCSVSMTAARSVTATFTALPTYVLTVNLAGSGGGTVSATVSGSAVSLPCSGSTCTGSFVSGTAVTLTATSNGTSSFVGWTGDCAGSSCTVSMTAARTVTATFNALASHLLTINRAGTGTGSFTATVGGSSVPLSCSGSTCTVSFVNGTAVAVVTTPAGGSTFDGWTGAGCSGTGACNVTMTAALTVTATFTASNIPVANPLTFRFSRRQPFTPITQFRYLVTLTGSSPVPGPLTFRITRFPGHRDVTQWDGALPGATYTRVDPVTGALTALYVATASEQSVVNQTTGVITGAPIYVYVPNICHDIFVQDTFEFIVIDSDGNESLPATVTMNSTTPGCSHG